MSTREKLAAVLAAAMVAAAAIYWVMQILGVIEVLRIAYG